MITCSCGWTANTSRHGPPMLRATLFIAITAHWRHGHDLTISASEVGRAIIEAEHLHRIGIVDWANDDSEDDQGYTTNGPTWVK